MVAFPAIPFSCFNARNLDWLAPWHTITTTKPFQIKSLNSNNILPLLRVTKKDDFKGNKGGRITAGECYQRGSYSGRLAKG